MLAADSTGRWYWEGGMNTAFSKQIFTQAENGGLLGAERAASPAPCTACFVRRPTAVKR
jgi:hypothetical protein